MTRRSPDLLWVGLFLGTGWWFLETLIHTFVFGNGALHETFLCMHDPNELWMRVLVAVLLAAFGWVAGRMLRAERTERDRASRLNRLFAYVRDLSQQAEGTVSHKTRDGQPSEFILIEDSLVDEKEIGHLVRAVQGLSRHLDKNIKELFALLELTAEINRGLLLDDVLNTIYESFRTIIPYNRIGVALLQDGGRTLTSRWIRADYAGVMTPIGYSSRMAGSSLERIIGDGEPRIIDDLAQHLADRPDSESSRLLVAEGIRSSLTCPLIALGKPVGFIFFSSRDPSVYQHVHSEVFKMIAGQLSVVIEKSNMYEQLLAEKETSESLLLNVMPPRIIARIKSGDRDPVEELPEVGVLFADIVGFTAVARSNSGDTVKRFLQDVFSRFDGLCERYGVEKIKTIGDAYMVSTGALSVSESGLFALAQFALALVDGAATLTYPDGKTLSVRVGVHAGPVVAGVIGQKKFAYDMWGDTVNIAHRLQSAGAPARVHVSERVYRLLQDDFRFESRGLVELKGEGPMATYFLMAK
ncbi:MAG: GAF domain-containing protein [Candidatus Hydrogenedentes bacterium]|nr:GAF domain-containing protein [Candidatus Hydrogenedentota bacterium]